MVYDYFLDSRLYLFRFLKLMVLILLSIELNQK